MSTRTKYNDGFFYGRRETPLDEAEKLANVDAMSPHDKGEFRKSYWMARVNRAISGDLQGCVQHMRTEDLKALHARLDVLYKQTLVDMYGEEGARKFLKEVGYPEP